MTNEKQPLIFIVGPTASGKTALSLNIAEKYNGEIISGDSMQVYRYMDIGTAKATTAERTRIRHHLIDCVEPNEPYSVAHFQEQAKAIIADIRSRGKLPIIAGGTGLYAEALMYDYPFDAGTGETQLRHRVRERIVEVGLAALHAELSIADPEAAKRIHPNDERRIVRAIELMMTGEMPSAKRELTVRESPYELYVIGLSMDRAKLYARIDQRVVQMFEAGWIQEVRSLLAAGFTTEFPAMRGLGYKELNYFLRGLTTEAETIRIIQRNTRRFAKRQLSWFRHMPIIEWFELAECVLIDEQWRKICATIESKFRLN